MFQTYETIIREICMGRMQDSTSQLSNNAAASRGDAGMATRFPAKVRETDAPAQPVGPVHLFVLAVGAAAIIAAYASRSISEHALYPVACAVLFAAAAILAALGWRQRNAKPAFVTYWDVSGALTLIGCAAAMMSEPENVMQLFELRQKN
jgi:hypothetical protein